MTSKHSSAGAAVGAQPGISQESTSAGSGDRTLGMLNMTYIASYVLCLEYTSTSSVLYILTLIMMEAAIPGWTRDVVGMSKML